MFRNRLLLSLVAGGTSFVLSLILSRDVGQAGLTGVIGLLATQTAAIALEGRYEERLRLRYDELKQNIRALQRRRSDAYDELMQLLEERNQVEKRMQLLQSQIRLAESQLPNPWDPRSHLLPSTPSWNLAEARLPAAQVQVHGLETRIQSLSQEEELLQQSLNQTLSAAQRAELRLTTAQAELQQVQTQLADQISRQNELVAAIAQLEHQHQELAADLATRQAQIQELEQYHQELQQFVQTAEPKHQEVEKGSRSLQEAITQMQQQISALHTELSQLEAQILDRRAEKQELEHVIALLQQHSPGTASAIPTSNHPAQSPGNGSVYAAPPVAPWAKGLGAEWGTFRSQLQGCEFEALRAIVLEENPASTLKRLAEEYLTMPELLIDGINERALEAIGDIILEPGSSTGDTIVAEEYRDQVATLIASQA
jgi:septal ring factor EnvC (AmiA/AmiB activator)